jgi:pSer/pThr/pTyr-binding forkhead associated (FHA) protein
MDAKLILLVKGKPVRTIELKSEGACIGRAKGNQIQIPVANVSRRHCMITSEGPWLKIKDLDSANGTTVNGERVDEGLLRPGDTLVVGSATFQVEYDAPESEELAVAPVSDDALEAQAALADDDELFAEGPDLADDLTETTPPSDSDTRQTIEISTVDEEIEAFPVDEVPVVEEDLGAELDEVEAIPLDSETESPAAIFADEDEEADAEAITLDESEPIDLTGEDAPTDVPKAPPTPDQEAEASGVQDLAALAGHAEDDSGAGIDALRNLADVDEGADLNDDAALGDFLAGLAESDDDK